MLTQSEISRILNMNMTSTYRYINTLVELGYLEKNGKTKEIRPSILCLLFCTNLMRATDHLKMITAVVDRVHRDHNISIDIVLAVDDTLVRLYHREAEATLTYKLPDFSRDCLHNTALGKAYLSSLPDEMIALKLDTMILPIRTDKTIADKNILAAVLKETRRRGYAIAAEEYLQGLIAIGAPLFDPVSGRGVGAVSFDFSVHQHSVREIEEKYGDLIQQAAKTLSELLPPNNDRRS